MAESEKIFNQLDVGESGPAFLLDHTDPTGAPRPDIWRQAVADFYQLDLDATVQWSQIGPAPLIVNADQIYLGIGPDSGEVTDILIDPTDTTDQIIYITTDDGGIWKTADGGTTWTPLTDQMFSISMGAVAMDPGNNNILYGGSGNLFDGGAAFTKGAGIYRSADAGLTWSIVDGGYFGTIFANVGISRIVCPAPDCLLVATNLGLYRSVDGGRNFGANTPDFNDRNPVVPGKICCLFLDSVTPASTVYAGVAGDSTDASGNPLPNVGLLRSTNAGITFPTNLFASIVPAPSYSSFVVAQSTADGATANSAVFYVSIQYSPVNATPIFVGFFRSTDSGATWSQLNSLSAVAAANGFGQTNYDLTIGVDPLNSLRVYAGFQQVWLSADGGNNFQPKAISDSKVHWDNHALVFSPPSHRTAPPAAPAIAPPVTFYTGTDGGIAKTIDGGANWIPINGKIATNLFRGIDIGRGAPGNTYTYGGCQDTGTSGHRPGDNPGEWHAGINGDGLFVAVDPSSPTTVYGSDDGYLIKSTDAGATWLATYQNPSTIGTGLLNPQTNPARPLALEQAGVNPATRTVYVGEVATLFKSVDAAATFTATPFALAVNPGAFPFNFITAVVTTTAAAATVWVGDAFGYVYCSLDSGTTWNTAQLSTMPRGAVGASNPVNHIAVDPKNPQRVAVVYGGVSGVNAKYRTGHIFLSLDSGTTWNDVSGTDGNGPVGNLPDLPLRSVVFDTGATPSAIIVAGDAGVLRSTDANVTGTGPQAVGAGTWKIYGAGLPMVCCNSLAIDNTVAPPVLRVGTYGRSCFEVTRPTGPNFAIDTNLAFGAVPVGQSVTLSSYVYNCGDAALTISTASIVGTAPFTIDNTLAFPINIAPGATQEIKTTFAPTDPGDVFVKLEFNTNDVTQADRLIPISGLGINSGLLPRLATNPIATIGFGTVVSTTDRTILVQLFNVGGAALNISAINQNGSTDFSLTPAPVFPIVVPPGGEVDINIKFAPTGNGAITSDFDIVSDDAKSPLKITANGVGDQSSSRYVAQILKLVGLARPIF